MIEALERRGEVSRAGLEEYEPLVARIARHREVTESLCVYVVGSYGRGEAIPHESDVDLFFVRAPGVSVTREQQLGVFSDLIDMHGEQNHPSFSRDCEFLVVHPFEDMYEFIGSPQEDQRNLFTARMLLFLEGKLVWNDDVHAALIDATLAKYFRDHEKNEATFVAQFLLNDITRYWKTLCLNYEWYRRTETEETPQGKAATRLQDLKLGFSRKLTCFSTVLGLLAEGKGIRPDAVKRLIAIEPMRRLEVVAGANGLDEPFDTLQRCYVRFLEWLDAARGEGDGLFLLEQDVWTEAKKLNVDFSKQLLFMMRELGNDDAADRGLGVDEGLIRVAL